MSATRGQHSAIIESDSTREFSEILTEDVCAVICFRVSQCCQKYLPGHVY